MAEGRQGKGVLVKFGKAENLLMAYLKENGTITLSKFRKIAGISSYRAETIIANMVIFRVLKMNASEKDSPMNSCQIKFRIQIISTCWILSDSHCASRSCRTSRLTDSNRREPDIKDCISLKDIFSKCLSFILTSEIP